MVDAGQGTWHAYSRAQAGPASSHDVVTLPRAPPLLLLRLLLQQEYTVPQRCSDPDALLAVMADLDAERLTQGLALAQALVPDPANPSAAPLDTPPQQLITAFWESILTYRRMEDADVAAAVGRAVDALDAAGFMLHEQGRFPGMYQLLAAPDMRTRATMHKTVRGFCSDGHHSDGDRTSGRER